MRRFTPLAIVAAGCLTVAVVAADALNSGSAGPGDCVSWSSEVKMDAYGYDHFVNLESKCGVAVACTIASSTNPDPVRARLPAGAKRRVLIWRGSPASELTANVTCGVAR